MLKPPHEILVTHQVVAELRLRAPKRARHHKRVRGIHFAECYKFCLSHRRSHVVVGSVYMIWPRVGLAIYDLKLGDGFAGAWERGEKKEKVKVRYVEQDISKPGEKMRP